MSRKQIGELLKKQRKKIGKKQIELVDDILSRSIISRIEKGDPTVPRDKLNHYTSKLGLILDDLEYTTINVEDWKEVRQQIELIENLVEFCNVAQNQRTQTEIKLMNDALNDLDKIALPDNHPYRQIVHYIRGKAFFYQKKYDRSKNELHAAIDLAQKYQNNFRYLNIEACSYNILSNIAYWEEGLKPALDYIERAVKAFDREGERKQEYFMTMTNYAVFLDNLGLYGEAERVIASILPESVQIRWPATGATVYELLAKQKHRSRQYHQALQYALEGLQISAKAKLYDRATIILLEIGGIYEDQDKHDNAEGAYQHSLSFANQVVNKSLPAKAYNRLGELYVRREQIEKAENVFEHATTIEADDRVRCDTLIGKGKVLLKKKKFREAVEPLKEALKLARMWNEKQKEFDVLVYLSQCFKVIDRQAYFNHLELLHEVTMELKER
ncbi:tetratricopeptide repeat protein [Thermoactinomyces sp. CICC 10522]|uniref:tetratricopeptide repeat protein n=1 Tax=Thermoactinomyces sp. CICC 10522 TaxID=2767427 RepID=UPI0018DC053C|nr:tetratricopeptide repeat protein [Thermoactinomyces sp. CICC 10522]MBH8605907.1 tetratricopeptide repeat protein [Thermoactinomyces sp. CICC 10522]